MFKSIIASLILVSSFAQANVVSMVCAGDVVFSANSDRNQVFESIDVNNVRHARTARVVRNAIDGIIYTTLTANDGESSVAITISNVRGDTKPFVSIVDMKSRTTVYESYCHF